MPQLRGQESWRIEAQAALEEETSKAKPELRGSEREAARCQVAGERGKRGGVTISGGQRKLKKRICLMPIVDANS